MAAGIGTLIGLVNAMLGWLPLPLYLIAAGVTVLFIVIVVLRILALIMDIIPFV